MRIAISLTHISLAPFLWDILANGADPDRTPHNAASDQAPHCLLTKCTFKNGIETYHPTTLKFEIDSSNW